MGLFKWLKRKKNQSNSESLIKSSGFSMLIPTEEYKKYEDLIFKIEYKNEIPLTAQEQLQLFIKHNQAAQKDPKALLSLQKSLITKYICKQHLKNNDLESLSKLRDEIDKEITDFVDLQVKTAIKLMQSQKKEP